MTSIIRYRYSFLATTLFVMLIFFAQCISTNDKNPNGESVSGTGEFAGSATCVNCHKEISEQHNQTAHFLTSRPASAKSIKGSFKTNENKFRFTSRTEVVMENQNDSFYQVAYVNGEEKLKRPFDIVIGSGIKGQSYFFWAGSRLFQLPITYYTEQHQWSNSPGFPGKAVFSRPITSRCLECHSTYFEKLPVDNDDQEEFNRNTTVMGVGCESCHGPGAKHATYQLGNPQDKKAKFIINPNSFTRAQQVDMCSLCHRGGLDKIQPSFTFRPGEQLIKYFKVDTLERNINNADVHGNQYGLMASSKCYKESNMTCLSCHDAHKDEKDQLEVFSQRCITCHQEGGKHFCKMQREVGSGIIKNCIDCHMPKQPSRAIAVLLQGEDFPRVALLRSHQIKIYAGETKKVMEFLKKQ